MFHSGDIIIIFTSMSMKDIWVFRVVVVEVRLVPIRCCILTRYVRFLLFALNSGCVHGRCNCWNPNEKAFAQTFRILVIKFFTVRKHVCPMLSGCTKLEKIFVVTKFREINWAIVLPKDQE